MGYKRPKDSTLALQIFLQQMRMRCWADIIGWSILHPSSKLNSFFSSSQYSNIEQAGTTKEAHFHQRCPNPSIHLLSCVSLGRYVPQTDCCWDILSQLLEPLRIKYH
ncbi:hypothetical protein PROFUN_09608 [Planoprotostelium fungivorum]|uniref:Uncharacterized protein n=1 Tax=Planoprotostelium fungivorum TaxID=1890364 RepID=A0A2P6MNS9_9EUKA|nr:hypothetical protein PROFUN_09608 [Planoprotostelium fungivorum]